MVALKNDPAESHPEREIVISRILHAPRELAWEAMTSPEHVVNWWGPRGFTSTIEEMNVKPGGKWNLIMHGPDGAEYPNYSVFTEVVKPERLVFVHGGHRKGGGPEANFVSTWTFDAVGENKTKVTIRMVFPTAEERDTVVKTYGAIEGGRQTLERLAEFMIRKGEPFVIERTFNAPIAKVWTAITDRDAMSEWYFDLKEFKPEVGFEFSFLVEWDDNRFDHRCRVTEVIPGRKLAHTWRYEGHPGESLVTWELFDEGGKTRLRLTHEGLDNFPKLPMFDRSNFNEGWTSLTGKLEKYLEKTT
jgi:uncharacterized protein YndB with AHSA1/START domain